MSIYNDRVTAYIDKAQPFAQQVLKHIRALVHKTNKEVEEKMKWGMPHFDYKGMYCGIASMKEHCAFGFWKASLLKDPGNYLVRGENSGMGSFGKIKSLADLPPDKVLIDFINQAKELNDADIKVAARPKTETTIHETPEIMIKALKRNQKANAAFQNLSPGKRKEYIEWIAGAKTDLTKEKRLATMLEWVQEGKSLNWRYQSK